MTTKYQLFIVAALCLALFLAGSAFILGFSGPLPVAEASAALQAEGVSSRTITVVGEGRATGAPDTAQLNIGVQVSDPDVKAATQKAADDMESLLAALKAQGIADDDIQTSYYNIFVDRPFGPQGPSSDVLYQVSNSVQVTIRNLDGVSTILGAAIEAGANNVNSINFNISDPSALRAEARQKAVTDALATAEELAKLNGLSVGEVVSISEVIDGGVFPMEVASAAMGLGGAGPISPGDVEVNIQLQITYALQ
jgi:hypothetical protein